MTTDIKLLLKQARRPETVEQVCLRGDLAATHDELVAELNALPPKTSLSDTTRGDLRDRIEAVRQEMLDSTVPFRLRAMRRADFQTLRDEHPPRREGDELNRFDAAYGFNVVTFFEPLIRACVVDPEFDADDWNLLFGEGLTSGQYERLGHAALRVNRREVDVPFSLADSEKTED